MLEGDGKFHSDCGIRTNYVPIQELETPEMDAGAKMTSTQVAT